MNAEIQQYLASLGDLRAQVGGLIHGQPAEALNWRPELPEGADGVNSLAVLAVHLAGSEHGWIGEGIGSLPKTRDRDAEFQYVAQSDTEPLQRLKAVAEETDMVLSSLEEADLDRVFSNGAREVSVRWAIQHMIFHYALHIGHMQLTYQLHHQGKAHDGARWGGLPSVSKI